MACERWREADDESTGLTIRQIQVLTQPFHLIGYNMNTNCVNCGYPVSEEKSDTPKILHSCPRCGCKLPKPVAIGGTSESDEPPKDQGTLLD